MTVRKQKIFPWLVPALQVAKEEEHWENTKLHYQQKIFCPEKWDTGKKMGRFSSCMQQNSRLSIESLLAKQLYISSFYNAPWRSIALGWLICFVLFPCNQSTRLQAGKLFCCVRFSPKISGKIDFTLQNTGERERAKGRRLLPTSP